MPGVEHRQHKGLNKCGVMLMDLSSAKTVQRSLFNPDGLQARGSDRIMAVLDSLNKSLGRDTWIVGSAGLGQSWATKAEYRSRKYTTSWQEVTKA